MSRFIESIKVEDLQPYLLNYHQERVNQTFAQFCSGHPINLTEIFKSLNLDDDGLFKFKITYDLDGNYRTQLIPYAISEISHFQLVENNSFDYQFKFEDRKILEQMSQKANGGEIIIVKNNCITDTSYSNLLFKKGREWFTPTTYLLNGVQRQHLLKSKKIKEAEITLQNLSEYSHFQIINAMNDFDDMFIYPLDRIRNLPSNKTFDLD